MYITQVIPIVGTRRGHLPIFAIALFIILTFASSANAATLFNAYVTNSVIQGDGTGFDSVRLHNPQVVNVDGVYYLYYGGTTGGNAIQIGGATSLDGVNWTRMSDDPVLRCAENTTGCSIGGVWSSFRVVPETVIYEDGMFKMWYLGNNQNLNAVSKLGYATSSDGVTWNVYAQNPVFETGYTSGGGFLGVVKERGQYLLYYRQFEESAYVNVATSPDGITWTAYPQNPLLTDVNVDGVFLVDGRIFALNDGVLGESLDGYSFAFEGTQAITFTDPQIALSSSGTELLLWHHELVFPGGPSGLFLYTAPIPPAVVANNPPTLTTIGNQTIGEGATLQFTVSATDPDGDALTYAATNLPAGATFNPATRQFSWTPTYSQAGNYENIEFTVTDDGSPMQLDVELITVTVGDVNREPVIVSPGAQEVTEGQLLTFTITATDPDGDGFVLAASDVPSGASFDTATGLFSWAPTNSQAGLYTVSFTATDNGQPVAVGTLQTIITVGDVPTPIEQADELVSDVTTLPVPEGQINSYLANLRKLSTFIEAGQIQPAINQLNAFISKVNTDYTQGNLTLAQKNDLIAAATALIADLQ